MSIYHTGSCISSNSSVDYLTFMLKRIQATMSQYTVDDAPHVGYDVFIKINETFNIFQEDRGNLKREISD